MNRAERRKMMKTIPGYKNVMKEATQKAVDDLEKMFQKSWEEDDETLNDGESNYDEDDDDDLNW